MKILSAKQMAEVDRLTTERYRIPSILLMENAGRSVADEIEKARPDFRASSILVVCGRGNNGGDGFVVARYLVLRGARPSVILLSEPEKLKGDALTNYEIAREMGVPIRAFPPGEARSQLRKEAAPDIIIDAIFGTGLSKPVGADFRPVVDWINRQGARSFVVAVDIPSGIMADSPEVAGPAVRARLTVTFSALKLSHVAPPAADYAGKVVLAPIGSPPALFDNPEYRLNLIDREQVRRTVPPRRRDSHKGSFGHVTVVAGSRGKSGAALMTGHAALRAGAGLVTLWLPNTVEKSLAGRCPELMTEVLPETNEGTSDRSGAERLIASLQEKDALVLGPGITTHPSTQRLVWELVKRSPVPVVLDADGINAFVPPAEPLRNELGQPLVITPHPGEMARLIGKKTADVQRSRIEIARDYAALQRCHVVLKGFQTIIASPEGDLYINPTGNPGMATGGTGDILSGMVGRFAAAWKLQAGSDNALGLSEFICAAVYLHGLAGDLGIQEQGMESLTATDLLKYLPAAFKSTL